MDYIESNIQGLGNADAGKNQTKYDVIKFANDRMVENVICSEGLKSHVLTQGEAQAYWVAPVLFGLLKRIVAVRNNGKIYTDASFSMRLELALAFALAAVLTAVLGVGLFYVALIVAALAWFALTKGHRDFKKLTQEHRDAQAV